MSSANSSSSPLTVLCLASYFKGGDFIRECHRQGCRTLLLTSHSLKDEPWPRESIDEIFYMPDVQKEWKLEDALLGVSYMARKETIDRIVALDDFDVETAATLREHLRVAGMGDTTARYFRDKLAMRTKAREEGLTVPEFIHVLNHARLSEFMERVPPPWVLKPRSLAGSMGIKKVHSADEFWAALELLGDKQSFYLLEQYVPGDIYHVDAIFYERELLFAIASRYGRPPMEVSQQGDIFSTRTLPLDSPESRELIEMNRQVMKAFGMVRGVSHSEFIRGRERRQAVFPGNFGARGRSAHRRSGGSGYWDQPVGGVGEGRNRRRQVAVQTACAQERFCRAAGVARQTGTAGYLRVQRSRDRLAHERKEASRWIDREVARIRSASRNCCTATSSACGRTFWRGSRRWTGQISENGASAPR